MKQYIICCKPPSGPYLDRMNPEGRMTSVYKEAEGFPTMEEALKLLPEVRVWWPSAVVLQAERVSREVRGHHVSMKPEWAAGEAGTAWYWPVDPLHVLEREWCLMREPQNGGIYPQGREGGAMLFLPNYEEWDDEGRERDGGVEWERGWWLPWDRAKPLSQGRLLIDGPDQALADWTHALRSGMNSDGLRELSLRLWQTSPELPDEIPRRVEGRTIGEILEGNYNSWDTVNRWKDWNYRSPSLPSMEVRALLEELWDQREELQLDWDGTFWGRGFKSAGEGGKGDMYRIRALAKDPHAEEGFLGGGPQSAEEMSFLWPPRYDGGGLTLRFGGPERLPLREVDPVTRCLSGRPPSAKARAAEDKALLRWGELMGARLEEWCRIEGFKLRIGGGVVSIDIPREGGRR